MADTAEIATTSGRTTPPQKRRAAIMRVKKGSLVVCEGRAAKVLAVVSPTEIWVSYLGTDDQKWVSLDALSPYEESDPSTPAPAEVRVDDDFEFDRATEWTRVFERFKGCRGLTPRVKEQIGKEMGVSRRTVERHFDLYQFDSSPRSQLPCKSGPEKGTSYLAMATLEIVDRAIEERYRVEERGSIQATADLARARCAAAGSKPPSYNTVLARIKTLDRWKLARERHGRVRGDAKAGPAGAGILSKSCIQPLEFVQMDHAIVDVIVVDPETREEIGRPWITLAIDVATRCILGFYMTFDAPSQTSVALALEHCCLPKDAWLKSLGISEPWLPFGLMKCIGWDNAKCFRNTTLINACREHGIEPRFRQVRTPVHGAHIERVIGTFMGRIHLIKGTTSSNTKGNPPIFSSRQKWSYTASASFWIGVMPPSAIFGRS